jgi:hypothetical protein
MDGIELIAAERQRQIEVEGWTPAHDAGHRRGELARAAVCYALSAFNFDGRIQYWPWEAKWYKPKDRLSDLVRAGALIAAALDQHRHQIGEAAWKRACKARVGKS